MKKRMAKLLTVALTIVMAFSMMVSAYAFEGEYFSTAECWDYTEEEATITNAVEAVIGKETNPDENAAGINNYNVYAVEMNIQGMDAQALYDSMADLFESEFKTGVQNQYNSMGWAVEFVNFETGLAYDAMEIYQYVLMKSEQKLTYDTGDTVTLYQNMAVFPADTFAVYVTVTNYESATACEEVLNEVVDYLYIENYYYGNEFADLTNEDIEALGKIGVGVLIGVLVFFLVILVVIIVVIVVAVKSSKKKKAQRMAQQPQYNFDPRTGQPIQNNQPWQYNPNGQQPPVNNNQYNPYGQQGNNYAPYTPSQPVTSEIKDPLDLDNK